MILNGNILALILATDLWGMILIIVFPTRWLECSLGTKNKWKLKTDLKKNDNQGHEFIKPIIISKNIWNLEERLFWSLRPFRTSVLLTPKIFVEKQRWKTSKEISNKQLSMCCHLHLDFYSIQRNSWMKVNKSLLCLYCYPTGMNCFYNYWESGRRKTKTNPQARADAAKKSPLKLKDNILRFYT